MPSKGDQLRIFSKSIPQMPEGYYSGDKPNPNLRAFVEAHRQERPYDPETDDYDVPAFDQPIETTKATAIYNMHTYWSKKPHDAICQYIRHYTQPGDLVLDPFCGSGGTALAALMEGCQAIAIDRSPAATFITKNYCTPVDVDELQAAFEDIKRKVKPEIDWLYETRCDRCGGKATTAYTVYSQVFQCPRCLTKVPLFDCVEVEGRTVAGKPKKLNVCPHCYKRGHHEVIRSQSEKFGAIPVLVRYICESGCKPARDKRQHNDPSPKKREYFEGYDLGKIYEIDSKNIPYRYPEGYDMTGFSRYQRDALYYYNIKEVSHLFTKRNLWALSSIINIIKSLKNEKIRDVLLFAMMGIIFNCSKMYREREEGRGTAKGNYYIPQISRDMVVTNGLYYKIEQQLIPAYQELQSIGSTVICISTHNACNIGAIPTHSVDYIFTDPPYAEKVQYGELNFVWEAWLGLDTHWHDEEIIVNEVRGKTEADWANMMRQAMAECYRVLKPGRWLSLCYHDTSEGTWALIQNIMADVGFLVDQADAVLSIDTGQKSYNQLTADKVNKRDLVINFRKPRPGELGKRREGKTAGGTFQEQVCEAIRDYLESHPGSTKDRIYDHVVSRLVRSGRMEAHDFDELLRQVADEVRVPIKKNLFEYEEPNLFGTHEIRRWYLKETESGAEQSDQSVADDASGRIEQFLIRQTEEELRKSQLRFEELQKKVLDRKAALEALNEDDADRKRKKIRQEFADAGEGEGPTAKVTKSTKEEERMIFFMAYDIFVMSYYE